MNKEAVRPKRKVIAKSDLSILIILEASQLHACHSTPNS